MQELDALPRQEVEASSGEVLWDQEARGQALLGPATALGKLVTPAEARGLPVHRWFLYPHSFSPGLVRELLRAFRLPQETWVYDPFSGAGTTLRTAQEEGYSAVGTDMLPLSALLSNAKVARYCTRDLERSWAALRQRLESPPLPDTRLQSNIPLVGKAFSPEISSVLAHIASSISADPSHRTRDFFRVALARLTGEVSCAVKSGGWPRLVDRHFEATFAYSSFTSMIEMMIEDVESDTATRAPGWWHCYEGDATGIPRAPNFGAVITSPPYLNRHDYTRVLALEHAVLFDMQQADLVALRRALLRSHVEARRFGEVEGYQTPPELAEALANLKEAKHTDRRVYPMIVGYFEDMFLTLRALTLRLGPPGFVAFVLGNVRFAGIMVPVEEAIRKLGEQVGLQWVATWEARRRGNSAQQMKAFGREPAREYIILWQKHANR